MRENIGIIILVIFLIGVSSFAIENWMQAYSNQDERKLAIYSVETNEHKIAISFDEGWGRDQTEEILDILDKHHAKATFFLVGGWVETYPEDVKLIVERGHELGNHTAEHKRLTTLSKDQIEEEIMKVHEQVKALTGIEMNLFRPPFGEYDNKVIEVAEDLNYYTIKWNVDSLDWKDQGVDHIVRAVMESEYLTDGSIILFHNNRKYTKDALDIILGQLKDKGYQVVTISELIIKDNYYLDATGRQFRNEIY